MFEQNDDKHSDAANTSTTGDGSGGGDGIGVGNSVSCRPPFPHELTAEWTVRAQLTFARAGEPVRREYNINDPINPVRVVYKWTNLDANTPTTNDNINNVGSHHETENNTNSNKWSRHSTPLKPTSSSRRSQSFRSTTSSIGHIKGGGSSVDYGGDSAFGGSNGGTKISHKTNVTKPRVTNSGTATAAHFGTRCQSTCNIVVSAVADFLPPDMPYDSNMPERNTSSTTDYFITEEEVRDPYTFNTTANYTVLPQKSFDEYSSPATPKRGAFGRMLALVDAMCQTSDTETKYFEEQREQQHRVRSRKHYEQRRSTADALLSSSKKQYADEGHKSLPSYTSSPGQTFKSASMSRIPPLTDFAPYSNQMPSFMPQMSSKTGADAQKKPRTVHIDVYCTGSEEDEQADGEVSSSASENEKHYEMESNSTPQTVLENEQMRLRHRRVQDQSLPRRLLHSQINEQPTATSNMQLGHAITKSSTADEVSESKQLLFRKHIGDQRAAKMQNLRQKYTRQASTEDVLSTSYANSSRSTMRDVTCSSMSSFNPSMHADVVDASWKEPEEEPVVGLTKSDSFDYDNSLDRLRIKRMERFWSRSISSGFTSSIDELQEPGSTNKFQHAPSLKLLQTISEGNSHRDSPFSSTFQRTDTLSESEHYPEHESTNSPACVAQEQAIDSPMDSSPPHTVSDLKSKSHFTNNRPGFLQFFGPNNAARSVNSAICLEKPFSAPVQTAKTEPTYTISKLPRTRWKSETRDTNASCFEPPTLAKQQRLQPQGQHFYNTQRCTSEAPASVFQSAHSSPLTARRFELHRESPVSVRSESSTVPPGYTPEYLELARKFGKVVAVRKPGHHIGPTKNPNCSCESCQRWLAERFQIRGRAFSLGECPVLKRPPK